MARPKGLEETFPLHTRLTGSQLAGFREYLRRQQAQIRHTGVQLTDAAVLRGMVLRALELENIPHSGVQPELLATTPSLAPVAPVAPTVVPSAPSSITDMTKTEIPEPPPRPPSEPPPAPVTVEPKKSIAEKAAPKVKPAPKVKTTRSVQPAPKVTKSATKPASKGNTKGPAKKATKKGSR